MERFNKAITNEVTGVPLAGIKFYVQNYPAGTPAVIYGVNDITSTPLVQPLTTQANGTYPFYAADGHYQITSYPPGGQPIIADFILLDDAANSVALAASSGSSLVGFLPAGTGAVATDVEDKLQQTVSVQDFGAVGDGLTDDTIAIQAALNSGVTSVVFPAGYTYLTQPLTTTQVGQKILAYGATIKLKTASTNNLFRANAVGVEIFGGTWDVNNIAHAGLILTADYCAARFATLQNCGAAGIYGTSNANYLMISQNVIKDAVTYGIYVDCLTADSFGNRIIDNIVDTSSAPGASGIYLTGTNQQTFFQRQWQVRGNKCNGSVSTPTGAGITTRAVDGICSENNVAGYTLGITCDITTRSVISNNRVSGVVGAIGYNIEVNGGYNTISGNKTKDGTYGLIITGNQNIMDHNVISGNSFENPTSSAIFISPTGGYTARFTTITGNSIDMSGGSTGIVSIYLKGDCIHSVISDNTFQGLGSGVANSYAVFIDTPPAATFISILGNTCVGFSRAFGVYSVGALTVTDLTADNNDISSDVSQSTSGWTFVGLAVVGARVRFVGNKDISGGVKDIVDQGANIFNFRTAAGTPEGAITAGIGSMYISTLTGNVSYVKSTGTGNTGWRPLGTISSANLTSVTIINDTITYTTGGVTLLSQAAGVGLAWRVRAFGTFVATNSATARNAQVAAYWGTTALPAIVVPVLASVGQTTEWEVEFILSGSSTTAVWTVGNLKNKINSPAIVGGTTSFMEMDNVTPASTTVTAGVQTLDLKFSMSVAVATDIWNVHGVTIERLV